MIDYRETPASRNTVKKASMNQFDLMLSKLKKVTEEEKQQLGIAGGLKVTNRLSGKLAERTNMPPGFVIRMVDQKPIQSLEDFINAIDNKKGVMIEGIYPDGCCDHYYLELS